MQLKSERLKKLEAELKDLEQWLKLGLVPKKEIEKHKEEIVTLKEKIKEEEQRLSFLKENGEIEEYVAPKRAPGKQAYAEPQTLPEIDVGGNSSNNNTNETSFEMDTESFDVESTSTEIDKTEEATIFEEMDDDPFSDKNRWKRGVFGDPDSDSW